MVLSRPVGREVSAVSVGEYCIYTELFVEEVQLTSQAWTESVPGPRDA